MAVVAFNDAWVMSAWGKANGVQGDEIVGLPLWLNQWHRHDHLSRDHWSEVDVKADSFDSATALSQRSWYQVLAIYRMDYGRAHGKIRHRRRPRQSSLRGKGAWQGCDCLKRRVRHG